MFVMPCLFVAVHHLLFQWFEIFRLQCVLARPRFMYHIRSEPLWTAAVVDIVVCALTLQSVNIYGGT